MTDRIVLDGRGAPATLDADVETSATRPGLSAFLRDAQPVPPELSPVIQPALVCGKDTGLTSTTAQASVVDIVHTTNNKVALLVAPTAAVGDSVTASAPTAAAVGVASGAVVNANTSRKGLILTNTSGNRISLAFGQAAVLDSGITLQSGQAWIMSALEGTYTTAEVRAIASAAASNLAIQEMT